jgi:hypothetical protein
MIFSEDYAHVIYVSDIPNKILNMNLSKEELVIYVRKNIFTEKNNISEQNMAKVNHIRDKKILPVKSTTKINFILKLCKKEKK